MGLGTLLTVVFVVLKLTGFIAWPWLGVFAPFIAELVIGFGIFGLFLLWANK